MSLEAFWGVPGAGKSYAMMNKVYSYLIWNKDKDLYSNMDINEGHLRKISKWRGRLFHITDLEDFVDAYNALVVIDEINLWAPSRMWAKIPQYVLWKWAQIRKSGLDIFFTAQHPKRVDTVVKELVNYSYYMYSFVKIGFFFYECYLGVNAQKKSVGFVRFKKKVAKIYDTMGFINVPLELGGANMKDRISTAIGARHVDQASEVEGAPINTRLQAGFTRRPGHDDFYNTFGGDEVQDIESGIITKFAPGIKASELSVADNDTKLKGKVVIKVGQYLVIEDDLINLIEGGLKGNSLVNDNAGQDGSRRLAQAGLGRHIIARVLFSMIKIAVVSFAIIAAILYLANGGF